MDQNDNDYGLTVTANGISAANAQTVEKLLTTNTPLMKLDRINTVSFQNVRIFFADEPPAPAIGTQTTLTTLVYSFPHGYSYTPQVWAFCEAVGVSGQFQGSITYFLDHGLIGGNGTGAGAANAYCYVTADATNVYFYVTKYTGFTGPQIFLAGSALNFRVYVFADDVQHTINS